MTTEIGATVTEQESDSSTVDFKDSLPEDIRGEASLSSIKDVTALAKGFVSAQKMLGSRIPMPTQEASKETLDEFYSKVTTRADIARLPSEDDPEAEAKLNTIYEKLGRPTAPDKYKLEIPEGVTLDTEYMETVKETAHRLGLNSKQLNGLASLEFKRAADVRILLETQKNNCAKYLNKEWGEATKEHLTLAKGVLSKYADKFPDAAKELENGAAGSNPIVILMAAELGKAFQENGTININQGGKFGKTPEQARDEIADIMSNSKHPYFDRNHVDHARAVEKMTSLYKSAHPEMKDNDL